MVCFTQGFYTLYIFNRLFISYKCWSFYCPSGTHDTEPNTSLLRLIKMNNYSCWIRIAAGGKPICKTMGYSIYERICVGDIINDNIPRLIFWSTECHGVNFSIRIYSCVIFINILYLIKWYEINTSTAMIKNAYAFFIKEIGKYRMIILAWVKQQTQWYTGNSNA